jgi:hypothetical protein
MATPTLALAVPNADLRADVESDALTNAEHCWRSHRATGDVCPIQIAFQTEHNVILLDLCAECATYHSALDIKTGAIEPV